ncbi:LuxR C-terminal-related transcriptional regulator [Pseudoclavibacter sp. RFBJ3]|uniref:LuxR C-terminal-related transcriptional regulator n=1 Tax=unclassified Pseudoclavibacter TaxID=2615177 RepID=UPI0035BEA351
MWAAPRRAEGVSLTPAEQRVVDALFTPGASTVSAAAALGISVNTVRNHVSNIRGKIGATPARNLDSLRFALMQLGILEPYPKVTSDDGVDAGLV